MKKIKILMILIFTIIIAFIIVDTVHAKIKNTSPVLRITEFYDGGTLYKKYKGFLVDAYTCTDSTVHTMFKWEKYYCLFDGKIYL